MSSTSRARARRRTRNAGLIGASSVEPVARRARDPYPQGRRDGGVKPGTGGQSTPYFRLDERGRGSPAVSTSARCAEGVRRTTLSHMITLHELTKTYAGHLTVDHVSFQARPGRVTGFLGPNGAGKS